MDKGHGHHLVAVTSAGHHCSIGDKSLLMKTSLFDDC